MFFLVCSSKGFEALTEIQRLLTESDPQPTMKESLLVDASNRFFTMIPSIHPHIIRDEDDFKSKVLAIEHEPWCCFLIPSLFFCVTKRYCICVSQVKMLEALQDIEIASRIVGFDVDSTESLDDKYKKLHCDISPLPHDSEDYRLIEKYLNTTHAPTHTVSSSSVYPFSCFVYHNFLIQFLVTGFVRSGVLS